MPELPEIETIKNSLKNICLNRKIKNFILIKDNVKYSINKKMISMIINQNINNIIRRGKHLLLYLNEHVIIIHLGMSGKITAGYLNEQKIEKHTHIIVHISNKIEIRYIDPRHFGYFIINEISNLKNNKFLMNYGPEPFSENFNEVYLYQTFKNKKSCIKVNIMNTKIVAGIGNIYASEILFASNIHPMREVKSLKVEELKILINNTKNILQAAIKYGGTTIKDFQNIDNKKGSFNLYLNVYNRENKKCYICTNKILKIKINTRSTFLCPICQKI